MNVHVAVYLQDDGTPAVGICPSEAGAIDVLQLEEDGFDSCSLDVHRVSCDDISLGSKVWAAVMMGEEGGSFVGLGTNRDSAIKALGEFTAKSLDMTVEELDKDLPSWIKKEYFVIETTVQED
jgi:hypothetical protein